MPILVPSVFELDFQQDAQLCSCSRFGLGQNRRRMGRRRGGAIEQETSVQTRRNAIPDLYGPRLTEVSLQRAPMHYRDHSQYVVLLFSLRIKHRWFNCLILCTPKNVLRASARIFYCRSKKRTLKQQYFIFFGHSDKAESELWTFETSSVASHEVVVAYGYLFAHPAAAERHYHSSGVLFFVPLMYVYANILSF